MYISRKQRTLSRTVAVAGFGYWSGRDVRVEFRPAAADSGIVFVRGDLTPPVRITALAAHRVETPRRTTLRVARGSVEMVEHIMAALAGLNVDNCEVWADAPEMPGCDGSSQPFVEALDSAGFVEQDVQRSALVVREVTRLGNDESWIEARPATTPGLTVKYRLDYGRDNCIGRQTLSLTVTPDVFRTELAPSRTFMLKAEAEWLQSQGLGKRATPRDLLVFDDAGPLDNALRYADECVRHKLLDLVGDLALAGCDLVGSFIACKSGHRLNAEMVRVLLAEGERIRGRRRTG